MCMLHQHLSLCIDAIYVNKYIYSYIYVNMALLYFPIYICPDRHLYTHYTLYIYRNV